MAEVKTEKAKGEKKESKKRTVAEIAAKGDAGLLVLVAQRAFGLSKNQEKPYKGSVLSEYKESSVGGATYEVTREGGRILSLEPTSDTYKKILAAGKKAFNDVTNDKLTPAVNEFINALMELKGAGGSGQRSGAILKGFSFKG